jgi:hypothetical protein
MDHTISFSDTGSTPPPQQQSCLFMRLLKSPNVNYKISKRKEKTKQKHTKK